MTPGKGVDVFLQESWTTSSMHQGMMGPGPGRGYGQGLPTDNSMMGALGQQLILTDSQGTVIYDSSDEYTGNQLTADELKKGIAIKVESNQIGTLLITPGSLSASNSLAYEFQASVRRAVISSAVIAGIIALALGIALFFQITAPMRKLRQSGFGHCRGGSFSKGRNSRKKTNLLNLVRLLT